MGSRYTQATRLRPPTRTASSVSLICTCDSFCVRGQYAADVRQHTHMATCASAMLSSTGRHHTHNLHNRAQEPQMRALEPHKPTPKTPARQLAQTGATQRGCVCAHAHEPSFQHRSCRAHMPATSQARHSMAARAARPETDPQDTEASSSCIANSTTPATPIHVSAAAKITVCRSPVVSGACIHPSGPRVLSPKRPKALLFLPIPPHSRRVNEELFLQKSPVLNINLVLA